MSDLPRAEIFFFVYRDPLYFHQTLQIESSQQKSVDEKFKTDSEQKKLNKTKIPETLHAFSIS